MIKSNSRGHVVCGLDLRGHTDGVWTSGHAGVWSLTSVPEAMISMWNRDCKLQFL